MKQISARNPAIDIIRCIALFCVNAVHFFTYEGLYWRPVSGMDMYLSILIRTALMVCVPLFIMLSGYLTRTKPLSRKYYAGIFKTVWIYFLASLVTIVAYHIFNILFFRERVSITEQFLGIFSFTTIPYAWYVEMYIGLFCLIPFLNILYNNLPSQKAKQFLILVLLFLTAVPSILNIHNLRDFSWWLMPSSSEKYHALVPSFWVDLYPVTYYYIGCYLSEYPIKVRKRTNILLFVFVTVIAGTFNYYRSYGANFVWGIWQDVESPLFGAQAVLVFIFLSQRNYDFLGVRARTFLAKVSGWCFGGYLLSWIWEQYIYNILPSFGITLKYRHAFLLVPMVYICSLATSAVLNGVYGFFHSRFQALRAAQTKNTV